MWSFQPIGTVVLPYHLAHAGLAIAISVVVPLDQSKHVQLSSEQLRGRKSFNHFRRSTCVRTISDTSTEGKAGPCWDDVSCHRRWGRLFIADNHEVSTCQRSVARTRSHNCHNSSERRLHRGASARRDKYLIKSLFQPYHHLANNTFLHLARTIRVTGGWRKLGRSFSYSQGHMHYTQIYNPPLNAVRLS